MKAYFISVSVSALISSVIMYLCPAEKLIKPLKTVLSLALICVMILPVSKLISSIEGNEIFKNPIDVPSDSSTDIYTSLMHEKLSEYSASYLERELSLLICEEFGIDPDDVSVTASYTEQNGSLSFKRILVVLKNSAILKDPRKIEAFVTSVCGLDCDCVL